jgi:hypothetical protein
MKTEKTENPVRKYLDDTGLSLTQFSQLTGISITWVHHIAKGVRPGRKAALKIQRGTGGMIKLQDFGW